MGVVTTPPPPIIAHEQFQVDFQVNSGNSQGIKKVNSML